MIQVCDAIMGTGKSSAAITYMNEHSHDRFIYITPYLDEAKRIKENCPGMNFIEPSNKIREYGFTKSGHTAALIKQGRNITTTHQAFTAYTPEMLADIREKGYRLIIDENVDVLEKYDFYMRDMLFLVHEGYVEDDNGAYRLVRDDYDGGLYTELIRFMKSRDLIRLDSDSPGGKAEHLFYWMLPPDLLTSFKDVFILTYLFKGQSLHHFLEMYHLPYEYIGIHKDDDGTFRFGEYPGYTPEYVSRLGDMIHILDNEKMNAVGDDFHALSMNWYDKNDTGAEQLQKNIYNCMNNLWRGAPASQKLWGCFKSYGHKVEGKGYTRSLLTFNAKATNAYRDRKYLVYVVNLFMNVSDKLFYQKNGIDVDEDLYALSIMVQWIWRSAIRDGDEIYLYVPSCRMRRLLKTWIKSVTEGITWEEAKGSDECERYAVRKLPVRGCLPQGRQQEEL